MTSTTTVAERPFESTASKLAFAFACWGLILAPVFALPAVVLGHIGRKKDKIASSKTKTAAFALILGYAEAALLVVVLYLVWPLLSR